MRSILFVALCAVPLMACDAAQEWDSGAVDSGTVDTGSVMDTGAHADTGTDVPRAMDAGTDAPSAVDTGSADVGVIDTGTVLDASTVDASFDTATDVSVDSSTPVDTGPPIPGDTCVLPIDVSAGGAFMADTCMLHDDVAASCGSPGGADVVLQAASPPTGSTYQITVPAGWVVQQVNSLCTPLFSSCGVGSWSVSGATGSPFWFFSIERMDGTCGMVTINVNRTM